MTKNSVFVIWDYASHPLPEKAKRYYETYFATVINSNSLLSDYLGNGFTFQFGDSAELLSVNSIPVEAKMVFVPAELRIDNHPRTSFRGLQLVKTLRRNRLQLPIVLFSFLDETKDFDFCDKDDFFNAAFMQFFVRLPDLRLSVPEAKHPEPLRELRDEELDNLLYNHYNKKQKASLLLDVLIDRLDKRTDDNIQSVLPLINHTFQAMVKWVPEKAAHGLYLTVLPNKLKRLPTAPQRIELLNQYRSRLLDGVVVGHDGLSA